MCTVKTTDVAVIGGGAAGMFAAYISALYGNETVIIEPNLRLGKKLLITGKGRCNLTNNSDNATIMKNIPRNPSFMFSSLSAFSSEDTMKTFEGFGVPLKTERGNRVFPVSDKAGDIVNALTSQLENLNVKIIHDRALSILTDGGKVTGVKCTGCDVKAPKVILATGGCSYKGTGSTGDGYKMAKELGHTVTPIIPSLVPLNTLDETAHLMGLSLRNVTLSVTDNENGKIIFKELGEMLFTHFGVSGPLVLSASSYMNGMTKGKYTLSIDLKPALDEKTLDLRLRRDFKENINRQFMNSLGKLLPEKLIGEVIKRSGIDPDARVNSITRQQRMELIKVLKDFRLTVGGFRPIDEAIITDGGVDVKEINPKTMESRIIKGLHFAGEIIDVTGFTGGFNLQIAFSTAYAAAQQEN